MLRHYCYISLIYTDTFLYTYQPAASVTEKNLSKSTKNEDQSPPVSQKHEEPVSAIFSLQDDTKDGVKNLVDSTEEQGAVGIYEEVIEVDDDDDDSIEEFDPEDPDFQEQEEQVEEQVVEVKQDVSPAIYKYDIARKSYVRVAEEAMAVTTQIASTPVVSTPVVSTPVVPTPLVSTPVVPTPVVPTPVISTQVVLTHIEGERQNLREAEQPNILKKRLLMPTKTSLEEESGSSGGEPAPKIQKLDLNNPLSVNNAPEEDGVMYVTVKGAKPNELLLVKVGILDT